MSDMARIHVSTIVTTIQGGFGKKSAYLYPGVHRKTCFTVVLLLFDPKPPYMMGLIMFWNDTWKQKKLWGDRECAETGRSEGDSEGQLMLTEKLKLKVLVFGLILKTPLIERF